LKAGTATGVPDWLYNLVLFMGDPRLLEIAKPAKKGAGLAAPQISAGLRKF